jgi:hypothetical protein
MQLTLESDEATSPNLTLFPEAPATIYNPEYAKDKAEKFSLVLGQSSPGVDVLSSDIANGDQGKYQEMLKIGEDTKILQRRNDILREIASNRDPQTPVSLDELGIIESLSQDELYSSDLGTVLEQKYSDMYTNLMTSHEENAVAQQALQEDDQAAMDVLDRVQAPMQRAQIANDVLQNTGARYQATSWASWGVDMAKGFIPLYTTIKGRERIETPTASLLSGNNREEQVSQLYALPPKDFKETLQTIIDELAADNMVEAMSFASDVSSYSSSDQEWANLGTVLDAASIVPVGKVASLAKGMATAGKAVLTNPTQVAKVAAAAGFNKAANIGTVTKNLLAGDFSGVTTLRRIQEVGDQVPSLFAPKQWMTGGTKYLTAEGEARLAEQVQNNAEGVLGLLQEGNQINRLEESQVAAAVSERYDELTQAFPSNAHKIIDTNVIPASADKITNTAVLAVRFGRQDGSFFKYEATAKRYAEKYIGIKTDDFAVKQDQLGGWYVEVQKPINDIGDFRNATIDTTLATPNTFNNKFARALRSPDYLVAEQNVKARGQVVATTEYLSQILDEQTKPFRGKSAQWYDEMEAMFRENRVAKQTFSTAADFENSFFKKFKKPPAPDQYDAYYRYVQLSDLDYIVRDADKVKRMTAKGLEDFSYKFVEKTANGSGPPQIKNVIGKVVDRLPLEDKIPFRVKIIQNGSETNNFPNMMAKWDKNKTLIEKLLTDGYKIVQEAESNTYVLIKDFKRNSIKMKTLGYIGGGHAEPKYDFYIRQGKIDDMEGAKVLTGDINLATVPTKAQADEIAKIMDQARVMVKNGDPGARKFIDENLPFSYGDFIKKVKLKAIDLDVPIVATAKGQRSSEVARYRELWGDNYHDYQGSNRNLLADTSSKFTTERSENLLDVYTTEKGAVFKQEWESVLAPFEALSSASRNMLDVRVLEDYAIKTTNDWMQEFGHLMDVNPMELKSNPRYFLQNPRYKSNIGIDKAEASRLSALSLFSQVESLDAGRSVLRDKVMSKVFDVGGEKARAFLDDNWTSARDVQTLLRRTTSNLKLNFWNTKQLFLQSSAIAATVAISPRAGWSGMRALTPTWFALHSGDDAVIRGLHNKFGKIMGWEKNEWLEMVRSMKQSGFSKVGGDTSYMDDVAVKGSGKQAMGRLKNSPLGKIASTHTVFFTQGELSARIVAYSTAYREWKTLNPTKALDRFAEANILNRAKTFTQNMTRESNSQWQKGWYSVATQFMGYNMRVAEQLWDGGLGSGKKLTQGEKVRFLATMSTLYGGGVAVSAGIPFIPTKEVLRDWMAEAGVDMENYPISDVLLDGLIATGVESMTGAEMDFSGYGPTGLPTLYDLMNEDKTWGETMMGASFGVGMDISSSLSNLGYAFGYGGGVENITGNDLLAVLRNVSTVDNLAKTYIALNTGKYISRKGTYLTDVSETEAVLQGILGVAPERVAESFATASALKSLKATRETGLKQFEEAHRSAVRALVAGDEDSYHIYAKRRDAVRIAYDLTPQEVHSINKRYFDETPVTESIAERAIEYNRKYKLFSETGAQE